MSDGLALAKTVWTDADFEVMGWHDNAVHAIAVEPALPHPGSLLLDIDHIVEWGPCPVPGGSLSFWVCPATLVFHQAWDLVTDINLRGGASGCPSPPSSGPGPTSTALSPGPSRGTCSP